MRGIKKEIREEKIKGELRGIRNKKGETRFDGVSCRQETPKSIVKSFCVLSKVFFKTLFLKVDSMELSSCGGSNQII